MKLWDQFCAILRNRLWLRKRILEQQWQAINPARQTLLATRLEVANSSARRNKGLLGRTQLAEGEGLWIVPCQSVHTFWMKFPIDLVYLDRRMRVKKLCRAVPAWRTSFCFTAFSVIELPAGTIDRTQTQLKDQLEIYAKDCTESLED
jgi:hypothetical protein